MIYFSSNISISYGLDYVYEGIVICDSYRDADIFKKYFCLLKINVSTLILITQIFRNIYTSKNGAFLLFQYSLKHSSFVSDSFLSVRIFYSLALLT